MLKARAWAEQFKVIKSTKNLTDLLESYALETSTLFIKRESKQGLTTAAAEAVVREQSDKFKAICRILPDFHYELFVIMMEVYFPDIWSASSMYRERIREHKEKLNQNSEAKKLRMKADEETDPNMRLSYLVASLTMKA